MSQIVISVVLQSTLRVGSDGRGLIASGAADGAPGQNTLSGAAEHGFNTFPNATEHGFCNILKIHFANLMLPTQLFIMRSRPEAVKNSSTNVGRVRFQPKDCGNAL